MKINIKLKLREENEMEEDGKISIQPECFNDGSLRLDGRFFPNWLEFQAYCIDKYRGQSVGVTFICGESERVLKPAMEEDLGVEGSNLADRIAYGCGIPNAISCKRCSSPC